MRQFRGFPYDPPTMRRTPFEISVKVLMGIIFLVVIGGIILSIIDPEKAGNLGAPLVQARDQACSQGCRTSQFPEQCYRGCMLDLGTRQ